MEAGPGRHKGPSRAPVDTVIAIDHPVSRLIGMKLFAVLFLISTSFEARAAISVERADYKAGVLVVRGQTTETNETVTLDG